MPISFITYCQYALLLPSCYKLLVYLPPSWTHTPFFNLSFFFITYLLLWWSSFLSDLCVYVILPFYCFGLQSPFYFVVKAKKKNNCMYVCVAKILIFLISSSSNLDLKTFVRLLFLSTFPRSSCLSLFVP